MHSILVLFQANTLNVAFNSHNKNLLTIMMSNNVRSSCTHCLSVCLSHWLYLPVPSVNVRMLNGVVA